MKIQKDKIQHFCVNLIVSYITAIVLYGFTNNVAYSSITGFIHSSGLSIGKEYGDKNATGNHWCYWDILADYVGNISGLLLFYLTILLWQI